MADSFIKNVSGLAPLILTDPGDPSNLGTLLSAIRDLHETPVLTAAQRESARLKSSFYFEAMDTRIANAAPPEKGSRAQLRSLVTYFLPPIFREYTPPDFYEPGTLKNIFDYVAGTCRSTVFTQMAILPQGLLRSPALRALAEQTTGNVIRTSVLPENEKPFFHLDFIQAIKVKPGFSIDVDRRLTPEEREEETVNRYNAIESSTSMPLLALDDHMMTVIAPHHPGEMLGALQSMITAANHDMLHHYTATVARASHANPLEASFQKEMQVFQRDKDDAYNPDGPLGYESSLVIGHAKAWEELKNTPAHAQLKQSVDTYFDELTRISDTLREDPALSLQDRHNIIDYFSTAAGFALMRIFPLNDPLLQHTLGRMEQVDPAADMLAMPVIHDKRKLPTFKTLQNYQASGFPLTDPAQPYKSAKQVELVQMIPDIALVLSPGRKGSDEYKAQQRSDSVMRGFMNILSRNLT